MESARNGKHDAAFARTLPPPECRKALEAWNMMRGLDWQALPIVAALLDVTDIHDLVSQLIAIREGMQDG